MLRVALSEQFDMDPLSGVSQESTSSQVIGESNIDSILNSDALIHELLFQHQNKTLTMPYLLDRLKHLPKDKEIVLLSQLGLEDWVKHSVFFVRLLLAVYDKKTFLNLFSKDYFFKKILQFRLFFPEGKVIRRATFNDYLQLLAGENDIKIALIDRLNELDYFSDNFGSHSLSEDDMCKELTMWPTERRHLLVNLPGNFFHYYDMLFVTGVLKRDEFFKYVDLERWARLVTMYHNYRLLHLSYDFKLLPSFERAKKVLLGYAPSGRVTGFFRGLTRTSDHLRAVKEVLVQSKQGTAIPIDLVSAVLQKLAVLPAEGGLYNALLYIAEANYVSLDEVMAKEHARRQQIRTSVVLAQS